MKKKIIALAAALCLALGAVGCGSGDTSSSSSQAETTAAETTTTAATEAPAEETTTTTTAAETTTTAAAEEKPEETSEEAADESEAKEAVELEYWTEDSPVKQSIIDWVTEVTDPSSDKFIPVEDRIVVSDMDGTLIGELYPAYFDYCMFVHRALYDEDYKDKASDEMKDFAHELEEAFKTRTLPKGSDVIHAKYAAEAYKGMTIDELREYTKEFMKTEAEGFNNLTRGEAYYKPMASLLKYLEANDFTIYVVSGTDRTLARELCAEMFGIPANRVIGTDTTLVAEHQEDHDGLDYLYQPDDEVVFGGEFITKNLKMNKVAVIAREIGIVPVLALGNSSGDLSMGQYTTLNSKYDARAYMLLCDDTEREYGKLDVAKTFKESCEELGFTTVSMKNDFATIYGDDVTITAEKTEEKSEEKEEEKTEDSAEEKTDDKAAEEETEDQAEKKAA